MKKWQNPPFSDKIRNDEVLEKDRKGVEQLERELERKFSCSEFAFQMLGYFVTLAYFIPDFFKLLNYHIMCKEFFPNRNCYLSLCY